MDEPPAKKVRKMVAPPPPNLSLSDMSICKKCNLVFFTDSGLERHHTTRNHQNVCKGLKPNFGEFFCYLCWDGFLTLDELKSHYLRETHEKRALEYSVKSTWMISGINYFFKRKRKQISQNILGQKSIRFAILKILDIFICK